MSCEDTRMEKHGQPSTHNSVETDNNVIMEALERNVQKQQQKPTQTEISAKVFLSKPSMIQQRSLDSAAPPFERQQKEIVIQQRKMTNSSGIRRSSTTPSNNGRKMTLAGYRYAPRPMETTPVSFPIPPVFPKTCSLYDSNFNGGAFASSFEDKKLMDALVKVRTKQYKEQQHISTQTSSMNEDAANLSDSGHSSITTEGTSTSPQLSYFSFFSDSMNNENSSETNEQHSKASLSAFTNDDRGDNDGSKFLEVQGKCTRRRSKRRSDFGLNVRKNSRIFFFRQRAKTASGKKEVKEEEDIHKINTDNELPNQPWTIDGGKGVSWKCKLLKALSAGGIYLPGASATVAEEDKGNELLFLFEK